MARWYKKNIRENLIKKGKSYLPMDDRRKFRSQTSDNRGGKSLGGEEKK